MKHPTVYIPERYQGNWKRWVSALCEPVRLFLQSLWSPPVWPHHSEAQQYHPTWREQRLGTWQCKAGHKALPPLCNRSWRSWVLVEGQLASCKLDLGRYEGRRPTKRVQHVEPSVDEAPSRRHCPRRWGRRWDQEPRRKPPCGRSERDQRRVQLRCQFSPVEVNNFALFPY